MCIIVVKKIGVPVPSMDTFENCFICNPDGAGIMYAKDGVVECDKGLMTFEAFEAKMKEYENEFGDLTDVGMVFHFRIGTHGAANKGNTHPFPLGFPISYDEMKQTHWRANQGFAHNGIMTSWGYHSDVYKHDVSDSMVFGRYVLSPISMAYDIPTSDEVLKFIDESASFNKFAIMNGSGTIGLVGDFVEKDGVYYSNHTFEDYGYYRNYTSKYTAKPSKSSKSKYSYYNDYDDYDDYRDYDDEYDGYNYYGNKSNNVVPFDTSKSKNKDGGSLWDPYRNRRIEAYSDGLEVIKKESYIAITNDDDPEYDIDGVKCDPYEFAISSNGTIYYWCTERQTWEPFANPLSFRIIEDRTNEVLFAYNCEVEFKES